MSLTLSEQLGLQTSTYFNVAGVAILMYDYAITLEDEIRWVWGRKWDVTRFFFTAARYLPFAGVGMTAYSALRPASQPCAPKIEENVLHILGIIASEVLLILRTYAFWQCDKRVLYGLVGFACVMIAVAVAFNVAPIIPEGNIPVNCLIASRNGTFVYLPLLAFEIVVLFLTAYKRFFAYRDVRTHIVHTIYRDGMFYILCILFITFANVLVDGIFPIQFSDLLDTIQISIHGVLSSRIMFNLRESSYSGPKGATNFATLSDIAYNTNPLSTGSAQSGSISRDLKSIHVNMDIELATR